MSTDSTPSVRRDGGFTLPELLVTIAIMGLIFSVLAAAIVTTLRQTAATEGRVNVARGEQSIDTWLPSDLASVDVTDSALPSVVTNSDDANVEPCGAGVPGACPAGLDLSGTNMLQLAWVDGGGDTTRVQYQFIEINGEHQLRRIECSGSPADCSTVVVLHRLDPSWMMEVTNPTAIMGVDLVDTSRQIRVVINGGGGVSGAGGGENQISLTAGGVTTDSIAPDEFTVPQFIRARSRCGGPVTLLIDNSSSIGGSDRAAVRAGAAAFVEAFRGTPVTLQAVTFSNRARVLKPGGNPDWNYFWDMSNDADVDALAAQVSSSSVLDFTTSATNWEDAWFRVAYGSDGTELTAANFSDRVVMFTDGVPTRNRRAENSGGPFFSDTAGLDFPITRYTQGSNDNPASPLWPNEPNSALFHQESFDRAQAILNDVESAPDIIAVGVGSAFLQNSTNWAKTSTPSAGPAPRTTKANEDILSQLITGADIGDVGGAERATLVAGEYTNPETANIYTLSDYSAFATAMKSAALVDCGGTLTIQTRLGAITGPNVDDEFVFENAQYREDGVTEVDPDPRSVTTSNDFRTGTFDFEFPTSVSFYGVDVTAQQPSSLGDYQPASTGVDGWVCRSGATAKSPTTTPVDGSSFSKLTVDVAANEAVSCILVVEKI